MDLKKIKKIKIGGHQYELIAKDGTTATEGSIGACYITALKISIDTAVPQSLQNEVLMHEIIEAINHNHELELEHDQITSLSTALHQVFVDNPQLCFK